MLAASGWLALGVLLLMLGADSLAKGGSGLALKLGASPARVGAAALLLFSALPELAFGLQAAMQGAPELAYDVLLARATLNLGLILGTLHLLRPLAGATRVAAGASAAALLAAGWFWWQSRNGVISRIEGILSVAVFGACLLVVVTRAARAAGTVQRELEALAATRSEHWRSLLRMAIGVAALAYGAGYVLDASGALAGTAAARALLPAVACSMPLLASAGFAGWRGFPIVAVGLVLGATLADLLLASGVLAFAEVLPVSEPALRVRLPLLLAVAALSLGACAWNRPSPRIKGAVLVLAGLAALAGWFAAASG